MHNLLSLGHPDSWLVDADYQRGSVGAGMTRIHLIGWLLIAMGASLAVLVGRRDVAAVVRRFRR